jgi:oligopeptide transport system substrate-binding protein
VDSLAGPDTLQFTLMEDDAAQLTAFQSGELDFIDAVPNDEIDALSSTPEFHKEGQIGTYYVSYNTQALRLTILWSLQAFTLAVEPRLYLQADRQIRPIPAGAFVSEGLSDAAEGSSFREVGGDYYDPTAGANEANLAKAKECWLRPLSQRRGPAHHHLSVQRRHRHQQIGEALQQMWGQLGATVTLESQEWATF